MTYIVKEVVLDMFFDLLNIKTPEWYQTFINGKRLTSESIPLVLRFVPCRPYRLSDSVPQIAKQSRTRQSS